MKGIVQFFKDGGIWLIIFFGPIFLLALPVIVWNLLTGKRYD